MCTKLLSITCNEDFSYLKSWTINTQAFCYSSLGIAHLLLQEPLAAVNHLQEATQLALISGDLYLQELSFTYLAEAHYTLNHLGQAVCAACLGMYLLEQISSGE
jgi:hypothetical protein